MAQGLAVTVTVHPAWERLGMHQEAHGTRAGSVQRTLTIVLLLLVASAAGAAAGFTLGPWNLPALPQPEARLGDPLVYGVASLVTAAAAGATAWLRKRT